MWSTRRLTMDILYVCNVKYRKSCKLEAIFNKKSIINSINPYVKDNSVYSEIFQGINSNVLYGNTREIMVFKFI